MSRGARALLVIALMLAPALVRADAAAVRQARQHYDRGMTKYQLGDFDAAIDEFKAAYGISQAPGLLFNLAQASRLGKHPEQALHFYRSYLRALPNAQNRPDVEARIAELEPIVRAIEREAVTPPPAANPVPSQPVPPPVAAPPEPEPVVVEKPSHDHAPLQRKLRIAGLTTAGVGLVAMGLGIYFGVTALNAQNQLSGQPITWSPSSQSLYETGQRDAALATAMYAIGGVAIAGGAALCVFGWHKKLQR